MEGTRAPQGLDAEDRLALGLGAAHLFYLVVFCMAGWALLSSRLPMPIRGPIGLCLIGVGVALAWGRWGGRPLDRWIVLYAHYRVRPRESPRAAEMGRLTDTLHSPGTTPPPSIRSEISTRGNVSAVNVEPAWRVIDPLVTGEGGRRARRVAFYSQTGGCGATTLALETATLVASLSGGQVAVLDVDRVSSTLLIRSGLDGPGVDDLLQTAGRHDTEIERVLLRHPGGVRVLLGPQKGADAQAVAGVVGAVCRHLDIHGYECAVFDVGTAALEGNPGVLDDIDSIYCVFTPTAGSVFGLYRAVAALRRRGLGDRIRLVLNRHDSPLGLDEILGDLRLPLVSTVPSLTALGRAETTHYPACLEDEVVADALFPLAQDIAPDCAARWFSRASAQASGGRP